MIAWNDPAVIAEQLYATVKFNHTVAGLYFWEMVVNLDYDWRLITKPRPGRSIYTMVAYLLCRWLCLAAVISILIGFDVTTEIDCRGWLISVYILGFVAFEMASALIAIRVVAIWQRSKPIIAAVSAALLTQFCLIVQTGSGTSTGACTFTDTQSTRKFYTATLCIDTFLLILMLAGLLRIRDARKHGLWKFLWLQGFSWVVLVMLVEIPSVTFLWLNLNQAMNVMFNPPELIALVISATRMYRSLTNFSDAYRPNAPSSGPPSTGPRAPVQVPIEVSVHRAYVTDRMQEDDPDMQFGAATRRSVEDKYDMSR
ncbi:unnamed protein product [Peniophora sp. CBMAI 1063]|nr:unnamed protein product [Peniophora sp. CBMAI 1063]